MLYSTLAKTNFSDLDSQLAQRLIEFREKALKQAVVINIDNIADYYYAETDQEYWDVAKDFPNIAPPFEYFWMEYKMPTFINSEGVIKTTPHWVRGMRLGAFFESQVIPDDIRPDTDLKWVMMGNLFTEKNGNILQYGQLMNTWGINHDGSLGQLEGKPFTLIGFNKQDMEERLAHLPDEAKSTEELSAMGKMFYPMLLAISFLHCKNVKMTHALPRARNRKDQTQKPPKVKVYTLEIEPMRRVLETEGQSQKTGLKKALHICRGHFKDFSRGAGLFGKFKGLYWWDSQLRGNAKYGRVDKDYSIDKPGQVC